MIRIVAKGNFRDRIVDGEVSRGTQKLEHSSMHKLFAGLMGTWTMLQTNPNTSLSNFVIAEMFIG